MQQAVQLSPQEARLIALLRTVDYGEVRIIMKDGKPIRVEEIQKSIRLD